MDPHDFDVFQTASLTPGNRLLPPGQHAGQADIERANSLDCGHRACQGCGEALGARYAIDAVMRATGKRAIACNATGCLEVFSTPYPESAWKLPWIHSLFGNAAAVATGVAAALKVKGHQDVRVIAQGGDGGTTDIGFGCLSGMFERNDDVLYICYDNQAYMNTGVQRSSATPPTARTATTLPVGPEPGNAWGQGKNLPLIAMAHGIPYVATATIADVRDLEAKVARAMSLRGARYLHLRPLPARLGLGLERHDTARTARTADRPVPGLRGRGRRSGQRQPDPAPGAGRELSQAPAPLRPSVRRRAQTRDDRPHPGHRRAHHPHFRPARCAVRSLDADPGELSHDDPIRHHAGRRHVPRQ